MSIIKKIVLVLCSFFTATRINLKLVKATTQLAEIRQLLGDASRFGELIPMDKLEDALVVSLQRVIKIYSVILPAQNLPEYSLGAWCSDGEGMRIWNTKPVASPQLAWYRIC